MDPHKIPWRGEISIQQVLAMLRQDDSQPFWIAWVRASGRQAGSIKIVSRALYGAPRIAQNTGKRQMAESGGRAKALHTEKGTLPMTDTTNGEYKTPLISHIIGFDLYKVKH